MTSMLWTALLLSMAPKACSTFWLVAMGAKFSGPLESLQPDNASSAPPAAKNAWRAVMVSPYVGRVREPTYGVWWPVSGVRSRSQTHNRFNDRIDDPGHEAI